MKKAFIIGNYNYDSFSKLHGVRNDIRSIEKILKLKYFQTYIYENLNFDEFLKFTQNELLIDENDEIIFYYAGHGLQVFDRFYFIPTDSNKEEVKEIEHLDKQCIYLDDIVKMLSKSDNTKIITIDACRENSLENEILEKNEIFNKGLLDIEKNHNFFIAFSTNSGNIAKETQHNGIYTKNLLNYLKKYQLSIEDIFKKTRIDIMRDTNLSQIPWEYSSLKENYYFNNLVLNCIYKIPIKFNGIETICINNSHCLISTQKSITYINLTKKDYMYITEIGEDSKKIIRKEVPQPLVRNLILENKDDYIEKIKFYKEKFYAITNFGNLYSIDISKLLVEEHGVDVIFPISNYSPKNVFSINKNLKSSLFGLDINDNCIVISDNNRNIFTLKENKIDKKFKCKADIYDIILYNKIIICATSFGFYKIKDEKIFHINNYAFNDSRYIMIHVTYHIDENIYFASDGSIGVFNIEKDEFQKLLKIENQITSLSSYNNQFIIFWDNEIVLHIYDYILKEFVDSYKSKDLSKKIYGMDIIDDLLITRYDNYNIGFWKL